MPKCQSAKVPKVGIVHNSAEVCTISIAVRRPLENLQRISSSTERDFLATCQRIYRADGGCTTPFEEFFTKLAISVQVGRWPSPDQVRKELETFDEDFADMQRCAIRFLNHYPKSRLEMGGQAADGAAA